MEADIQYDEEGESIYTGGKDQEQCAENVDSVLIVRMETVDLMDLSPSHAEE